MARILKIEASKTRLQIDINRIYQQRKNPGEREEHIFEKMDDFKYLRERLNPPKKI